MARDLTCIICPRGCALHIDGELNVTGNACPRGAAYAKQEVTDPRRTLTSTVKCRGKLFRVCPVKTALPIPKDKVSPAMDEVNAVEILPPVHIGDVVIKNIAGTGIDLVATRDIEE
ncbi:MAG: DUF1667 domain-containing protein [Bacilli bacterium]|nr:DUF1667 domain-containing protein [Bacilli bacterium]